MNNAYCTQLARLHVLHDGHLALLAMTDLGLFTAENGNSAKSVIFYPIEFLPPIEVWEVLVQTWREGEKGGEGGREGTGGEVEGGKGKEGERRQGKEKRKRKGRGDMKARRGIEGRREGRRETEERKGGGEGRGGERRGEEMNSHFIVPAICFW